MDTNNLIRELAKSIKFQNLFIAAKEINGVHLFKNLRDFSRIQDLFLSYLYTYESIHRDILTEKISKHIFDSEIYEDAYLLWKKGNINKQNHKDNSKKRVDMVVGNKIKFPPRGK